jgi:electron transport complex protein RnfA
MSLVGIAFMSVFGANALLRYGAGACSECRRSSYPRDLAGGLAFLVSAVLSGTLHGLLMRFALRPLGLGAIDAFAFALVSSAIGAALALAASRIKGRFAARLGDALDRLTASCAVYGVALAASGLADSGPSLFAASIAGAVGYLAATVVLDAIRERLELERIPDSFKGAPAYLISAGLLALAFHGLETMLGPWLGGVR